MRPRSISTRAVWAHTWHWKKASCISGISWDVLITMPLMAMSWSMSVRSWGERSAYPSATACSPESSGLFLELYSCQGRSRCAVEPRRILLGMAVVTGRCYGQGMHVSLGILRSGLGCPSCVVFLLLNSAGPLAFCPKAHCPIGIHHLSAYLPPVPLHLLGLH